MLVGLGLAERVTGFNAQGRPAWVYKATKRALLLTATDPEVSETDRAIAEEFALSA